MKAKKLKEITVNSFSTHVGEKQKETIQGQTAVAFCSVWTLSFVSVSWSVVGSVATVVLGCLVGDEEKPKTFVQRPNLQSEYQPCTFYCGQMDNYC